MTDNELHGFRKLYEAMAGAPTDWQWVGKHMSQHMFGITQERAEAYARLYGGEAKQMTRDALNEENLQ